jgi:post-segregation antitoxin (ccd killing protein)
MTEDKAQITVRVPLSVRDDMKEAARSRGVTLSRLATDLVLDATKKFSQPGVTPKFQLSGQDGGEE